MMEIPTLTTERLLLRAFRLRDFDAYADIVADPEVTRFLGDGRPVSRADAWRQIAFILGHWELLGYGLWAVEERATGALVGITGRMSIAIVEGRHHYTFAFDFEPTADRG